MKTFTEINSYPLPVFDTSFPEDFPVSFQTHSQCHLLKAEEKKLKSKLFKQVFDFVEQLIDNENFYQNLRHFLLRN